MPKKKTSALDSARDKYYKTRAKHSNNASVPLWWGDVDEKTKKERQASRDAIKSAREAYQKERKKAITKKYTKKKKPKASRIGG